MGEASSWRNLCRIHRRTFCSQYHLGRYRWGEYAAVSVPRL